MAGRLIFGHLPDRIGGARVALVCVLIEAVGQALIWLAPWSIMALFGAAVTGFGYSLVYPGFGVEAVRRAPPESRGLAMGAYTAFLDLALGLANPALGLVASGAGLGAVFLVSTLVVMCAAAIAVWLLSAPSLATASVRSSGESAITSVAVLGGEATWIGGPPPRSCTTIAPSVVATASLRPKGPRATALAFGAGIWNFFRRKPKNASPNP